MDNVAILWADDEIELLKPHILFLKSKGYYIETATSGRDAVQMCRENHYDLVFLDENMPGISGLQALQLIKDDNPSLPVVMITKSEEEYLMEEAIGSKISDYLIKPVNPNQILLSIKKIIDNKRIVAQKTTQSYQQDFRKLGMAVNDDPDATEWSELYQKLVNWEIRLEETADDGMREVFNTQKTDANIQFSKFISNNYLKWLGDSNATPPVMSHNAFKKLAMPFLEDEGPFFLLMIDNLRLDQYKALENVISEFFRPESMVCYYAILPTCTEFARNAFFAGLMPSEIQKLYPSKWVEDGDEGSRNQHEEYLLGEQLKRYNFTQKWSYNKITNPANGTHLAENMKPLFNNKLNVIVYNFVDMLSHARSEMNVLKELARDEAAYRSLTKSWFEHSPLMEIMRRISEHPNATMAITTDHGSIRCNQPTKIIGDRNTNTNLRFKEGKNLNWDDRDVFVIEKPEKAFLPKNNLSTTYAFCTEDKYFVYPNNYHHFVNLYRDTFQHGGISLEEMIIPFGIFTPR